MCCLHVGKTMKFLYSKAVVGGLHHYHGGSQAMQGPKRFKIYRDLRKTVTSFTHSIVRTQVKGLNAQGVGCCIAHGIVKGFSLYTS